MPRRGYVSITIRRETWEKLQKLKLYTGALTYDDLIDKIYSIVMKALEDIDRNSIENIEKIYEIEKIVDNIAVELEFLKTQISKLSAKIEFLEKKSRNFVK